MTYPSHLKVCTSKISIRRKIKNKKAKVKRNIGGIVRLWDNNNNEAKFTTTGKQES